MSGPAGLQVENRWLREQSPGVALLVAPPSEEFRFVERALAAGGQDAGLTWRRAGSCPEAEALLGRDQFKACLFDLALGEASALRFLRTLQARRDRWTCPVIVLGRAEDEDLIVRVLAEGATDYLLKGTADEASILRAVRYAIGLSRRLAASRAAEVRAQALFESGVAGVFRLSLDGDLVACNRAYLQVFGYGSMEEAIADPEPRLRPGRPAGVDSGDWILELVGPLAKVLELRRVDGSPVTVKLRSSLLVDTSGSPEAVEGSLLDISWLEGSLNPTSPAALEHNPIWEIVSDGLLILDRAGRIEHTNGAACQLLGRSRESLIGTTLLSEPVACKRSDGSAWRPEEFPPHLAMTLESPIQDTSILVRQPDGRYFSLFMTAAPVESFGGSMSRRVVVALSRLPAPASPAE